jgi:hypothetical protein
VPLAGAISDGGVVCHSPLPFFRLYFGRATLPFCSSAGLQATASCPPVPFHQSRLYITVALLAVKTTNQLHPCGVQTLRNALNVFGIAHRVVASL